MVDIEAFDEAITEAIDELQGQALSGNIARKHHLVSAVECFADIGILLKASTIVHETLDIGESDDEEPS